VGLTRCLRTCVEQGGVNLAKQRNVSEKFNLMPETQLEECVREVNQPHARNTILNKKTESSDTEPIISMHDKR